jgi:hypothetical protein
MPGILRGFLEDLDDSNALEVEEEVERRLRGRRSSGEEEVERILVRPSVIEGVP